jgi:transcriptional regulator with XRE-family HTH domain
VNRFALRAIRLRHRLSLTLLARQLGLTLEQLTKMESGKLEVTPEVERHMKGLEDDN